MFQHTAILDFAWDQCLLLEMRISPKLSYSSLSKRRKNSLCRNESFVRYKFGTHTLAFSRKRSPVSISLYHCHFSIILYKQVFHVNRTRVKSHRRRGRFGSSMNHVSPFNIPPQGGKKENEPRLRISLPRLQVMRIIASKYTFYPTYWSHLITQYSLQHIFAYPYVHSMFTTLTLSKFHFAHNTKFKLTINSNFKFHVIKFYPYRECRETIISRFTQIDASILVISSYL